MSQTKRKLISITVPVLNEEENITPFYAALKQELDRLSKSYDYEFIFTDNRSTDSTFARLQELAERDERVRIARFSRNFGYQKSIYTGYCLASGDCAIEMDVDLQDPPHLLPQFIAKWEEGYEVVYGIRNSRKEGWLITQIRKLFYRFINLLSDDQLPLNAGDFRLVDRKVLDQLRLLYDATPYLRGAIASMGFNQFGISYDREKRVRGQGKFNFRNLVSLAIDGILNHSIMPLRLATLTGFAVVAGLILYTASLFILTLFFHFEWPKGFATLSVLILISICLNAFFLGIIGEYLGRIYRQIKGRPLAIIDQMVNIEKLPVNQKTPAS
jgi:dolichol-phosphate mannosyltransferase